MRFRLPDPTMLVLLLACSGYAPVCVEDLYPAILVRPVDSLTGLTVPPPIMGAITEGTFLDSLRPFEYSGSSGEPISYGAGHGRPGIYHVTLTAPGYAPWQRANVRAKDRYCGVIPTRLQANLQPP